MIRGLIAASAVVWLGCSAVTAEEPARTAERPDAETPGLPFPEKFDPERYLGKWHEAARLPTPFQPAGTLATAEYSEGENEGEILVKNTLLNAAGEQIGMIEGKARLFPDDPPRMAVSFGPVVPIEPNYFVIHVDDEYQQAVIGNPDRRSLHILVREAPVSSETLEDLIEIASEAGFDTEKLVINPWESTEDQEQDASDSGES